MTILRLLCVAAIAAVAVVGLADTRADAGVIRGNSGGNERDVSVWGAGIGNLRYVVTGPAGRFRFDDIPPGEYLVRSGGISVPGVRVESDRPVEIVFAPQPRFDPPIDTWSPGCRRFAQTFVATGPRLREIGFWIPSPAVALEAVVRRNDPDGTVVGPAARSDGDVGWITRLRFPAPGVPLTPGRRYCLEIASTSDRSFALGMPGPGDVYPHGHAWFDGNEQPDSDLGARIDMEPSNTLTLGASDRCLGWIETGPGAGNCREAAQTFVAGGDNVVEAFANAGWGKDPPATTFLYSIRRGGPDGNPVGPELRVDMISDWGATAAWHPGAVPLTPGETYALVVRREDGDPFYAYLTADDLTADGFADGVAWKDEIEQPGFDLWFSVKAERSPGALVYPWNVGVEVTGPDTAVAHWETGRPAAGRVALDGPGVVPASFAPPAPGQRVPITGLAPGDVGRFRPVCRGPGSDAVEVWGPEIRFLVPPTAGTDRPWPPSSPSAPDPAGHGLVRNGGFEDGLDDWTRLGDHGKITPGADGYLPRSGSAMFGWADQYSGRRDEPVFEKVERRALLRQTVAVEPGRQYVLAAWILTGDRACGWARDSRVRLVIDARGSDLLDTLASALDADATQWFATRDQWRRVHLPFTATADTASIGVHFDQWWELEASYLYVDDVGVTPR